MAGTLSRSWSMTKESWRVLRSDSSLLILPVISSIALLGVMATFAVPVVMMLMDAGLLEGKGAHSPSQELVVSDGTKVIFGIIGFCFYFVSFTVMNFFNVALVGAALERFEGRPGGVGVGLRIATQRIPQILLWSLVAASVGMLLKWLEDKAGFIGRIAIAFVGMAWAIGTFFVVPVLAAEGVGPIDALKRSVAVLKESWGEAALTRIGVGSVFSIAIMVVLVIAVAGVVGAAVALESIPLAIALGAIAMVIVIALGLISTTLQTIIQAAVYRYAAHKAVAPGFSAATLRGVFEPKGKK
jgi:hypothetical protein